MTVDVRQLQSMRSMCVAMMMTLDQLIDAVTSEEEPELPKTFTTMGQSFE